MLLRAARRGSGRAQAAGLEMNQLGTIAPNTTDRPIVPLTAARASIGIQRPVRTTA